MQSGRHAAHTIVSRLRGDDTTHEFRYRDLGTMATVSRFRAVAWFGPVRVAGPVAWLLWLVVHLAFLTGFKNRVATLASWTVAFLGRGRPERTITEQQVFARTRSLESSEPRHDGSPGRMAGPSRANPEQEGRDVRVDPENRDTSLRRSIPARRWAGT
jgi:NADH dehydrogenase